MKLLKAVSLLSIIFAHFSHAQTRLILSAALTPQHHEYRKNQYIKAFNNLQLFGYTKNDIYVVEALNKNGPTFLDDYSSHVYYAQNNNPDFTNKGINEAVTLLEALEHFDFDDNDMIIKITGRHLLTSDRLFQTIKANPGFDAYVKFHPTGWGYSVAFAMKRTYLKEMLRSMDLNAMGHSGRAFEHDFAEFIKMKSENCEMRVFPIETLHIKADMFGSTTAPHIINVEYM